MSKNQRELPKRKSLRLKGFDYSQPASYFITICCQNRAHLFGKIVNGKMHLSDAGKMIERWFFELENKFPDVKCHEMVVMPDHFHCVLQRVETQCGGSKHVRVDTQCRGCKQVRADTQCSGCKQVRVDTQVHPNRTQTQLDKYEDSTMADLRVRQTKIQSLNLCACPITKNNPDLNVRQTTIQSDDLGDSPKPRVDTQGCPNQITPEFGDHSGSSLFEVMQWFKTMSTNEYIRGVKTLGWPRFYKRMWQRNYYEIIIQNERSFINISNYIRNNPAKWSEKLLKRKYK